ncbi:hypothetical protein [Ornithinimicrobium cerasi]|uniref:hypothetical protein n=1 Tax=Ornithinimicrobium cerasi TaxID=2248773 RepID=UPI000BE2D0E8|nr:hypothetical protein [Ornithinimicrobium cerasi]
MNWTDAVISSLLPATLGILGVFVGSMVSKRADHRHWLRERKVAAVSALVEDTSLLVERLRHDVPSTKQERAQWLHALQSGRTTIHLLCEQETIDAAEHLVKTTRALESDKTDEALRADIAALKSFIRCARREVLT